LVSIGAYLFILSSYTLWSSVGIPHLKAVFADTQAILAASDAYRDGYNPYIEHPYDPLGRLHVYPRPWLWLGYVGLTLQHSRYAAILLIVCFLLLSIVILRPANIYEVLISAMLLLSPAVMLGVERGKNDLIIFVSPAFALFLLNHNIRALKRISFNFLFLAAILKIYPIASFLILPQIIKDNKKFWTFTLVSTCIIGAYALFSLRDMQHLKDVLPKPHGRFAFGSALLFQWLLNKWPVNATCVY